MSIKRRDFLKAAVSGSAAAALPASAEARQNLEVPPNAIGMLYDAMPEPGETCAETDRRHHDRVPFPSEMTLVWNHDLETTLRYGVSDAGDGGYRLRSSTPMLEGMTGIALRLLPEGTRLDVPVMVAWCRKDDEGEYVVGLRVF